MKLSFLLLLILLFAQFKTQGQAKTWNNNLLINYLQGRQYDDAISYLKNIQPDENDLIQYWSLSGYIYYQNNQVKQAESFYKNIIRRDSSSITANYYLGRINEAKQNYAQALYYYQRLVQLQPASANYNYYLARSFDNIQQPDSALKFYEIAYSYNNHNADITAALAAHLITKKDFKKADSILYAGLANDSLQAKLIIPFLQSEFLQKNYGAVLPLGKRLLQMQNIDVVSFTYFADAYYELKRYKDCLTVTDTLLAHQFKTETVYYFRGMCYKHLKQYQLSLAMFDQCLAIALSKSADTYFTEKGKVYEALHRYHAARLQYDTAYYIFQNPLELYNKALLFDNLKNYRTALHYYESFLRHSGKEEMKNEKDIVAYVRARIKQLKNSSLK